MKGGGRGAGGPSLPLHTMLPHVATRPGPTHARCHRLPPALLTSRSKRRRCRRSAARWRAAKARTDPRSSRSILRRSEAAAAVKIAAPGQDRGASRGRGGGSRWRGRRARKLWKRCWAVDTAHAAQPERLPPASLLAAPRRRPPGQLGTGAWAVRRQRPRHKRPRPRRARALAPTGSIRRTLVGAPRQAAPRRPHKRPCCGRRARRGGPRP
jgi:hypothetical protein